MKSSTSNLELLAPCTLIAPGVGDASLLTKSRTKGLSSRADLASQALRPGADQASKLPSRFGHELHYPDGTRGAL